MHLGIDGNRDRDGFDPARDKVQPAAVGIDGGTPDGAADATTADAGPNVCESDGSASDARQE